MKAPKKLFVGLPLTIEEYRFLKEILVYYRDNEASLEEEEKINSILERIDFVLKYAGDKE